MADSLKALDPNRPIREADIGTIGICEAALVAAAIIKSWTMVANGRGSRIASTPEGDRSASFRAAEPRGARLPDTF